MKQYRVKSRTVIWFGYVLIKEKVQVKRRWFWKTIDTRYYGPYPSRLDAYLAIENRGGAVINY